MSFPDTANIAVLSPLTLINSRVWEKFTKESLEAIIIREFMGIYGPDHAAGRRFP